MIASNIHTTVFHCCFCREVSITGSDLKIHVYSSHAEKRAYFCGVCGEVFPNNHDLDVHTRIHPVKKPYICDTCNKGGTFGNCTSRCESNFTPPFQGNIHIPQFRPFNTFSARNDEDTLHNQTGQVWNDSPREKDQGLPNLTQDILDKELSDSSSSFEGANIQEIEGNFRDNLSVRPEQTFNKLTTIRTQELPSLTQDVSNSVVPGHSKNFQEGNFPVHETVLRDNLVIHPEQNSRKLSGSWNEDYGNVPENNFSVLRSKSLNDFSYYGDHIDLQFQRSPHPFFTDSDRNLSPLTQDSSNAQSHAHVWNMSAGTCEDLPKDNSNIEPQSSFNILMAENQNLQIPESKSNIESSGDINNFPDINHPNFSHLSHESFVTSSVEILNHNFATPFQEISNRKPERSLNNFSKGRVEELPIITQDVLDRHLNSLQETDVGTLEIASRNNLNTLPE